MMMEEESIYDQLEKDVTRIRKSSKMTKVQLGESIDSLIEMLSETKKSISTAVPMEEEQDVVKQNLQNLHQKLTDQKPMKRILQNHKNFYAYLTKFSHNINKLFSDEINLIFRHDTLPEEPLVLEAIAEYLLMEKQFDLYEQFTQQTGIMHTKDEQKLSCLKNLQHILESLMNHKVDDALIWAEENKLRLQDINNSLLFSLHRLQFLLIIKNGTKIESISYARKHFKQFFLGSKLHADQAQKAMGLLLASPELIEKETDWTIVLSHLQELVINGFSQIHHLSAQCALLHCIMAGTLALPKFIKYAKVASACGEDSFPDIGKSSEYPIEVDPGKDFQFHSIFVCPVTREVIDPEHHAVLLPCGHVIAESSMKKITDSSNREKFKCYTCPKETTVRETKIIYF